ncbi:MAG: ferredoxin [Actinomycetota bacterium]|nr:ferredoxin [Actinomycetota bacterium]
MKIIVDTNACSGHGRCAALAPSVYVLDERGYNAMHETEVAPEDEAAARAGASNCPERAITLVD